MGPSQSDQIIAVLWADCSGTIFNEPCLQNKSFPLSNVKLITMAMKGGNKMHQSNWRVEGRALLCKEEQNYKD